MGNGLDKVIQPIYDEVIARNPAEKEFHQAVKEVLESLGPVLVKHPEFAQHKIIQRICEPERQIIFRIPWTTDKGEDMINRGFRVQFKLIRADDFNFNELGICFGCNLSP